MTPDFTDESPTAPLAYETLAETHERWERERLESSTRPTKDIRPRKVRRP